MHSTENLTFISFVRTNTQQARNNKTGWGETMGRLINRSHRGATSGKQADQHLMIWQDSKAVGHEAQVKKNRWQPSELSRSSRRDRKQTTKTIKAIANPNRTTKQNTFWSLSVWLDDLNCCKLCRPTFWPADVIGSYLYWAFLLQYHKNAAMLITLQQRGWEVKLFLFWIYFLYLDLLSFIPSHLSHF